MVTKFTCTHRTQVDGDELEEHKRKDSQQQKSQPQQSQGQKQEGTPMLMM